MSVLFVSNFLSSAGLNRGYTEELADRMESRGWRVIRTSAQPNRARRLADMMATAWNRRHDYDVAQVDVYSGAAFVWAELVCLELSRLRKPFILTLRGGNLPDFARRWPRRVRRLFQSAALVTAPSPYLAEQLREYRQDLVVVRNAIDSRSYGFRTRATPTPQLIWVRAFHEIYNPVLAVEVLAQLARTRPDATLRMLGPDKDGSRALVEERSVALGVRERLEIVGMVPKAAIAEHLATADLFINTTNIDNTPISVLEAMAAGLCVVSTSVGGLPYLVEHGHNALLVPPRDAPAMTAALERTLDEPGLASRLSERGHELALACDWSPVLTQWESVLAGAGAHRS